MELQNKQQPDLDLQQHRYQAPLDREQLQGLLEFALFQRKYEKALQVVDQLIMMSSHHHKYYFARAEIYFHLEKYPQSINDANLALKQGADQIKISNHIIKCYIQSEQNQKAKDKINEVLFANQQIKTLFHYYQTLEKIQNHKKYRLPQQEQNILKSMKEWLYNGGARYDKMKVVNQNQNYRGVITTKSIKKKQIIVYVPRNQIITLQLAKKNQISLELIEKNVVFLSPKHSFLSIFLLEERAKQHSRWKLYLDILPKDHSVFPINYQIHEFEELIGSSFLFQIREKVLDLKKDYDLIFQNSLIFVEKKYTFKDFCWARMMVGSRVFGVFIDNIRTQILVPFADMLNHKLPKQTVWNFSQQMNGFYIQSLQDINVGEQVFDSYGKKCNSRFLLNYAFVTENNDRNQVCISVQINEKDQLYQKKLQMLKIKTGEFKKIIRINKYLTENNFFELMGYFRFKAISKLQILNTLQRISKIKVQNTAYNPSRTPPLTLQIQKQIWIYLKQVCEQNLKAYPTTRVQDLQLLKNQGLSENMKNILILRSGQKQVFQYYVQISKKASELLNKQYEQIIKELQKSPQEPFYQYIYKMLAIMPHEKNKLGLLKQKQLLKKQKNQNFQDQNQSCQVERQECQYEVSDEL